MPFYSYKCQAEACGKIEKKLVQVSDRDKERLCPDCGQQMKFCLPDVAPPSIMETVNKERNVKQRKNMSERTQKRARDYFVKNGVTEAIGKTGPEHARKVGWIKNNKVIKPFDLK